MLQVAGTVAVGREAGAGGDLAGWQLGGFGERSAFRGEKRPCGPRKVFGEVLEGTRWKIRRAGGAGGLRGLGPLGRFWEGFGKVLGDFGRFWEVLGGFGEVLGRFRRGAKRRCRAVGQGELVAFRKEGPGAGGEPQRGGGRWEGWRLGKEHFRYLRSGRSVRRGGVHSRAGDFGRVLSGEVFSGRAVRAGGSARHGCGRWVALAGSCSGRAGEQAGRGCGRWEGFGRC